ncbi:MAG TPA: pyridoxal phosphate-dependent aminotransferase [Anaerolineae bacterium]|nr:pyridoxal phosphate-dependent aminotransferase [Anaerolineae bacterium]HNU03582.1 pyridoxal phosphate-dependent aminotransferase [Anaerolineae bacterium]
MKLSKRMSRLGTETAFEVLAKAKALEAQGREIIHLEIGEPDFDTPHNVIEAGVTALRGGYTHYTPAAGILPLRQAIADEVAQTRGIPVHPDQVVVVPGGKPIMFYVLLAMVEAGDEVIYPNPGFPIYESMINFTGATAVPIPLRMENDFGLDVDELASLVTDRTRLIVLNSPANPTGGIVSAEQMAQVAKIALERGIPVLADEIYSRMLYEGEFASITSVPGMPEQTIILDGFSKTYAMTGWRLGYGVMPVDLARQITKLMVNSNSCTAAFTQMAGVEALTGPQDSVDAMLSEFRRRRTLVVDGLNQIPGFRCLMPKGAFYAFPNIEGTGLSSQALADKLLYEAGVAALAGTCFGAYGEGFIRFSYANSEENLKKALERIGDVVAKL